MRHGIPAFALLCALCAGCANTQTRDGFVNSDDAVRCISLARIDRVNVLDNQSIEFHMRGGESYINILPHSCPGLRRNQPFMYRTSLNQLCDLDIITVLDQGGFGLRPMGSCGLGRFEPLIIGNVPPVDD